MDFGATYFSLSIILVAGVTSVHAAVAACDDVKAFQCTEQAFIISKATGCDYRVAIPFYTSCVSDWISGCNTLEQLTWEKRIRRINETLHGPSCNPECPDQAKINANVDVCRNMHTGLDNVAKQITSNTDHHVHNHTACDYVLPAIRDCMLKEAASCPLVSEAVTIELWSYSAAFNNCLQALPPPYIAKTPEDILKQHGITPFGPAEPLTLAHEKISLFVAIGVCLFIIVVAAAITGYTLWSRRQKAKKKKEKTKKKAEVQRVYVHDTFVDETMAHDDEVSQYGSMRGGPYRPRGRTWWDSYGGMDPQNYANSYEPDLNMDEEYDYDPYYT